LSDDQVDAANEQIITAVNATGRAFLSHTRVRDRLALRIAIGHAETREEHVREVWNLIQQAAAAR
jgi:aromatic-L-amino-acid decarboxylase